MAQFHCVYLRYAIGELEHDAIMVQARRCGVDSVKKLLDMIVGFEIDRFREEYVETLSEEALAAYEKRENGSRQSAEVSDQSENSDLDTEIPF